MRLSSSAPGADPADPRPPIGRVFRYPLILGLCVAAAVAVIWAIQTFAPPAIAVALLDYGGVSYPFSVQNVEWIVFALGIGELIVRAREARAERRQLALGYLPEDETTVLQSLDLREIFASAKQAREAGGPGEGRFLPRLIHRIVIQFQTSRSVDQANSILNSSLELYLHEIDLKYTMVRYVIWAIPTLGFLGTVLGIALALNFAGHANVDDPAFLSGLTGQLAVAFNTTLVALVMSAILVLIQHVVQAYDERALNLAGQYCLDNLINRLYGE